jgi:hypothetical protein
MNTPGYSLRYVAQMHASTAQAPGGDPRRIPYPCDSLLGSQLQNPPQPSMINTVGYHGQPSFSETVQ